MSPPASRGAVVNVPLWLWIDNGQWAPTSATASVDGLSVQTTATPDRVIWSLGTGDEVVCDGPGTRTTRPVPKPNSTPTARFRIPERASSRSLPPLSGM
jgi:hypothetical protein